MDVSSRLLDQRGEVELPVFLVIASGKRFLVSVAIGQNDQFPECLDAEGRETVRRTVHAQIALSNKDTFHCIDVLNAKTAKQTLRRAFTRYEANEALIFCCADGDAAKALLQSLNIAM